MIAGLRNAGLTVVDLSVAPTPAVPFASAHLGVPLGVALTASHNPASQNGVKFFINGLKLLPEGPVGDFALSALAYQLAHDGFDPADEGGVEDGSAALDAFADYIAANLPAGAAEALGGLDIVFDPANGAFSSIGRAVFAKLGLRVLCVNDTPLGHNINQGGGVAELEGKRLITAAEAKGSPALSSVAAMLDRSASTGRPVYGLVLDGDGDRGFLVAAAGGEAHVADGDAVGYVIARHLRESKAIPDSDAPLYHYVASVESDLNVFREAGRRLGLATDITCVGDKWLVHGFRGGRKLAVGEEVSGHVLWPTAVRTPDGEIAHVLTGNGLLTALSALAAAARLGLEPARIARPFPEGAFVTRYTYNVNKAMFFPGSHAWGEDLAAIGKALDALKGASFASWRVIDKPDEPEMLYVGLFDSQDTLVGAVFARNSGTENKTGVYARGEKTLEPVLGELCQLLWKIHRRVLKDKHCKGFIAENAVLKALESGPLAKADLPGRISDAGETLSEQEIDAILFGMRKEGLIEFQSGRIARLEI
jgi:phosphoglucosamine mutase